VKRDEVHAPTHRLKRLPDSNRLSKRAGCHGWQFISNVRWRGRRDCDVSGEGFTIGIETAGEIRFVRSRRRSPELMGIGPIVAIPKALKVAGLSLNDIDLIELNEAFAVQSLAVIRELEMDESKVNVNGGAMRWVSAWMHGRKTYYATYL